MNRITATALIGASALALWGGAAAAQPAWGYDVYGRHDGYDHRDARRDLRHLERSQAQLERRIERSLRRGELSPSEAVRMRLAFRQLVRLEARYRADGLSRWEIADLDRRYAHLEAAFRYERADREYGYGYGYRW